MSKEHALCDFGSSRVGRVGSVAQSRACLGDPVAVGVLARGAAPAPGGVLATLFPGSVLAGFPPSASVGVGGRRSRRPAVAGFVWFSLRLHSEEAVFWCTHLG